MSEQAPPYGAPVLVDRIPPHNEEAEQSALASMLLDKAALETVAGSLTRDDFYGEAHRVLFGVMSDMAAEGQPVDLVTLCSELQQRRILERVGGLQYLTLLPETVPTARNAAHYAAIVARASAYRRIIEAAHEALSAAYLQQTEPQDLIAQAQDAILRAMPHAAGAGFQSLSDLAPEMFETISDRSEGKQARPTPTGFPTLDSLTAGGYRPGDLWIVAARPSVGKTSYALTSALRAARSGCPVAFFSLEMPREQILERAFAQQSGVDLSSIRGGDFGDNRDQALGRLADALGRLSELPFHLADQRNVQSATLGSLGLYLRRLMASLSREGRSVGLVVLDQLNKVDPDRPDRLYETTTAAARGLKVLAMRTGLPFLVLHQLNRSNEREQREPRMSDLQDSGAVEQEADVVAFLHNPQADEQDPNLPAPTDLIIAKQRQGAKARLPLSLLGRTTTFVETETRYGR